MMDFSILVCTYNGGLTIIECLNHLYQLDYPKEKYEVIIVDNNSSDFTSVTVREFILSKKVENFQLYFEAVPGKSFAFQSGFAKCSGRYLVTCDDDNLLSPHYLTHAKKIFIQNPEVGIIGGFGEIKSNGIIPKWFYSFQRYYACGAQHFENGDITELGSLWGAGMIFDAVIFRKLIRAGFVNLLTCRKGTELTSGGDIEYCRWFLLAKKRLWYDQNLTYFHFIPKERLTPNYITRLTDSFKLVSDKIYKYDAVIKNEYSGFFKSLYYLGKLLIRRDLLFTQVRLQLGIFGKFFLFDEETRRIQSAIKKYQTFDENPGN